MAKTGSLEILMFNRMLSASCRNFVIQDLHLRDDILSHRVMYFSTWTKLKDSHCLKKQKSNDGPAVFMLVVGES